MNLLELYEIEQELDCINSYRDKIDNEENFDEDDTEIEVDDLFWKLHKSNDLADSRWRNSRRHWR